MHTTHAYTLQYATHAHHTRTRSVQYACMYTTRALQYTCMHPHTCAHYMYTYTHTVHATCTHTHTRTVHATCTHTHCAWYMYTHTHTVHATCTHTLCMAYVHAICTHTIHDIHYTLTHMHMRACLLHVHTHYLHTHYLHTQHVHTCSRRSFPHISHLSWWQGVQRKIHKLVHHLGLIPHLHSLTS